MTPIEQGRQLAELIPGARFVPLESKNHILLTHEPAWQQFLDEVHRFLQVDPAEQKTSPIVAGSLPPASCD